MAGKADAEATARVEAALYSAGRPLSMEELIRASGTGSRARTREIVDGISRRARAAFRAIEVVELPDGSRVLQLKPEMGQMVRRYASRPVLPSATLKTLSYIVYSQPVSTRQLVETRGTGVYTHLRELRQLDFVSAQPVGRVKIYTTTPKFQKYFGVEGDPDALKKMLFAKVRRASGRGAATPPRAAPAPSAPPPR